MTFPKGYNSPSLKQESIHIKRVVLENYSFGVIELESSCGNPIRVYDLERTLCDFLPRQRQRHSDRGRSNEEVRGFQRKRHTQTDAVRKSASREAQSATLYGGAVMITKNPMQLKAFIKKKSAEKNISAQLVMQNYMLERLLERISLSKYKHNFILKGGFLTQIREENGNKPGVRLFELSAFLNLIKMVMSE